MASRGIKWLLWAVLLGLTAAPAHAAFPGQNGRIAFTGTQDGDAEIYSINPDGTDLDQLTSNAVGDFNPAWSPDGQKIVFTRIDGSDRDIWVMSADGTDQARILEGVTDLQPVQPTWSPDGLRMALAIFGSQPECDNQPPPGVYTMDADGSNLAFFECAAETGGGDGSWEPAWSPGGDDISFAGGVPDSGDLYSKPASGGATVPAVNLTHTIDDWEGDPDWSPNGAKLAYGSEMPAVSGNYRVRVMNRDGSGQVTLREGSNPHWSPDGSRIAFSSQDPPTGIWIMNANGAGSTFLTAGSEPSWQPIIKGYARPKAATPLYVPLVPAYTSCTSPNRTHAAPLSFDSCYPPAQTSAQATVGTPDANANPAKSVGALKLRAIGEEPALPENGNQSDLLIDFSLTDVREQSNPADDYTGELRVTTSLRITDRNNNPHPGIAGHGTVSDTSFEFTVNCSTTPDTTIGSTCAASTSANAVIPGQVLERQRAIWQLGQVEVHDGGTDDDADTPGDNTLFAVQGVFVP